MPQSYRAAVIYGPGDIRVDMVPWEDPAPNEVVIRVEEASICPSDLREYRGIKAMTGPVRRGHEFAGYAAAVGSAVKNVKEGDRVTAYSWVPCFQCRNCRRGKFSACEHRTMNMGGFAEYVKVPGVSVLQLPDSLDFGRASVTEPLASILKADTEISQVTLGDTVVVYGLGPMGIMHAQSCKLLGAEVIGIDLIKSRRDLAEQLGAVVATIDPKEEDPVARVKALTHGRGADVVLVTVGGRAEPICTAEALKMVAYAGRINIYAGTYPDGTFTVDPNVVHYGEVVITGTRSYNLRTFELALDLIASGRINVEAIRNPLVTLTDIKHGVDIHGTAEAMKVGVHIKG